MSLDSRLSLLLDHWQQSQEAGQPLAPEELCRDHPELRSEVERQIGVLKGMECLSNDLDHTQVGQDKVEGAATVPPNPVPGRGSLFHDLPHAEAHADHVPAVPGFDIEGELGRGGWGVVYRARQKHLNRTVALKMILAGGHAGAEEHKRFLVEAEVIASLQHPGIVQVYEFGTHQGLPWFALEYCANGSLANKLGGTPLPPREAATVVEQIASGRFRLLTTRESSTAT